MFYKTNSVVAVSVTIVVVKVENSRITRIVIVTSMYEPRVVRINEVSVITYSFIPISNKLIPNYLLILLINLIITL